VNAVAATARIDPIWITAAVGLVSPIFALIGAKIGVNGAIHTQVVSQGAVADRERSERERREGRIRNIFGAQVYALQMFVVKCRAGYIWDNDQIVDEFKTLDALVNDPKLLAELSEQQANDVIEAATSMRFAMKNAAAYFEDPDLTLSSANEAMQRVRGEFFAETFKALNQALESFGRKQIPRL